MQERVSTICVEMEMRVEFDRRIPRECFQWLRHNVGEGNMICDFIVDHIRPEHDWYYERIVKQVSSHDPNLLRRYRYIDTVTVKDPELATIFILRWL